jgi:hypothetical protein
VYILEFGVLADDVSDDEQANFSKADSKKIACVDVKFLVFWSGNCFI